MFPYSSRHIKNFVLPDCARLVILKNWFCLKPNTQAPKHTMYSVQVEKIIWEDYFCDFLELGESYLYFNEMFAAQVGHSNQVLG